MMKATKQSQQRCCPFVCERSSAWLAALSRRETCASLEAPSSMRCVTRTVFAREQDQIAWKSWVSSTQKRSRGLKPLGSETRTKAKYSSCLFEQGARPLVHERHTGGAPSQTCRATRGLLQVGKSMSEMECCGLLPVLRGATQCGGVREDRCRGGAYPST